MVIVIQRVFKILEIKVPTSIVFNLRLDDYAVPMGLIFEQINDFITKHKIVSFQRDEDCIQNLSKI